MKATYFIIYNRSIYFPRSPTITHVVFAEPIYDFPASAFHDPKQPTTFYRTLIDSTSSKPVNSTRESYCPMFIYMLCVSSMLNKRKPPPPAKSRETKIENFQ